MPAVAVESRSVAASERPRRTQILGIALVALWSASLFETGLQYFMERIGISLHMIAGALLLLLFSFSMVLRASRFKREALARRHRLAITAYVGYWVLAWFGVLYTPVATFDAGFKACLQYSWYTVLALASIMIMRQMNNKQRRDTARAIGIVSLLVLTGFSAIAIRTGVTTSAILREAGGFSIGAFKDYNVFTFALLLSAMLAWIERSENRSLPSKLSMLWYVAMVLFAVGLGVLSGSRRSLIAYGPLALGVPLVLLFVRSRRRFLSAGLLLVAVTIGGLGGVASGIVPVPKQLVRVDDRVAAATEKRIKRSMGFVTGEYDERGSRLRRWRDARDIVAQYSATELVIGRGPRSYLATAQFTRPDGSPDTPHNFVLAALMEGGILSLTILLAFLGAWCWHVFQQAPRQSFWVANLLITGTLLWVFNVSISGDGFFTSRHFMLLVVIYSAFWRPGSAATGVRGGTA